MGKYKAMDNHRYADMYGMQMKDEYDDEGNLNDNEHANKAMIRGHQANNYDMRRAHEMLQDDGFRRHMKQEGFSGVDRMVKDNMPSTQMLSALNSWGKDIGTHNGKGSFDTRDLGATFKAFAGQNREYSDNKMQGMIDSSLEGMKPAAESADMQQAQAEETLSPELEADENVVREFDSGLGIPSPYGNNSDDSADEARAEQGAYPQMTEANSVATPEGSKKAHSFLSDWKTKYDFSGKKN